MSGQRKDIIKKIKAWKLRPVRKDGVFLLLDEIIREEKTPGGIIVPVQAQQQEGYRNATVISVGSEVTQVVADDRVLIGKYYGMTVPHEDENTCKLIMVTEDQIDAAIE